MRHKVILPIVGAGVFMSTLDSSMVNVALPTLMRTFGSSLALTQWVVLVYLLTITGFLLFWGYFSTRYGLGRVYRYGLLIFSLSSLCSSLAPTIHLLILSRFIQALGGSMMMAVGPALIRAVYPPGQLGAALGRIGIATSLGLMTGPVLSGLLIHWFHWRLIFLITVPVGVTAYFLANGFNSPGSAAPEKNEKFDLKGGLLWIAAVTSTVLLASTFTHQQGKSHTTAPATMLTGIITLGTWFLLLLHERSCQTPLLPTQLFKKRFFAMAILSSMLSFMVLFFVIFLIPFYLTNVRELGSDTIGLVMMAIPLCVFFVAPVAGMLYDRIGARIIATTGQLCCLLGLILLTGLSTNTPLQYIGVCLALLGFGQAMFLAPNSAAALAGVNSHQAGITSSLLATARNMGMLLGTALAALLFTWYFSRLTGGLDMKDYRPDLAPEFLKALNRTFQVGCLLAFGSVTASWCRGEKS
ncbi:MFS transporter [Desulfolithobacter sp.]